MRNKTRSEPQRSAGLMQTKVVGRVLAPALAVLSRDDAAGDGRGHLSARMICIESLALSYESGSGPTVPISVHPWFPSGFISLD